MTDRRVEVRGLDAHLLNHVGVRRGRDAAAAAGVGRAVDRVVVAADAAERGAGRLRGAVGEPLRDETLVGGRVHAGREAGQHDRHVREHRQAFDHARVEVLTRRNRRRVEQRGPGGDVDRFGDRADFDLQRQAQLLPDRQHDIAPGQRLEAGHHDRHLIRAGLQQRGFEVAAAVGDQRLRRASVEIRDRDGRAGDDALVVSDGSQNAAASFLCVDGKGEHRRQQEGPAALSHVRLLLHEGAGPTSGAPPTRDPDARWMTEGWAMLQTSTEMRQLRTSNSQPPTSNSQGESLAPAGWKSP